MRNQSPTRRLAAFTLIEAMIAVMISGIALAGALSFYINTSLGHYIVDQRVAQASSLRRFSQELIYHASRANQIYLYKSATLADRDEPSDQLHVNSEDPDDILRPAGNFVVFVYYETPKPLALDYHRIEKIVGYYLDADANKIGPIRKITIDLSKNMTTGAATLSDQVAAFNATDSITMVEKVMKDNWSSAIHARYDRFLLNARGLFESELPPTEDVGRLFYYRDEHRSMMVAGQVYGTSLTTKRWTYTDSFNFSITPRS